MRIGLESFSDPKKVMTFGLKQGSWEVPSPFSGGDQDGRVLRLGQGTGSSAKTKSLQRRFSGP